MCSHVIFNLNGNFLKLSVGYIVLFEQRRERANMR